MANVLRVFRARVKEGKEREFQSFFLHEAPSLLRRFDGLLSVSIGLPIEISPRDFLMITTWRDVESLSAFSGDSWMNAVIDPQEKHLLEEVWVDHYYSVE